MAHDNVLARRRTLLALIDEGCVDERIVDELLPAGVPLPDEDVFWDYKESLPVIGKNPSEDEKAAYAAKMAEVAKDAVAFYNMYGGYLLVGVTDSDRTVCGFAEPFDANDLCKKLQGATREHIDVKFRILALTGIHLGKSLGLLYFPRRLKQKDPVQFLKDAPASKTGKKAYLANEIYMRSGEECRKATTSADFSLLFSRERLGIAVASADSTFIENNLPAKDPNLIEFIGRDEQIDDLWRWFVDRYTAVKLLSGSGGVGKTSIAWTFCDAVSRTPPSGLEKVIWLTAKRRTFAAMLGSYIDIAHTHFTDLPSLLLAMLAELGIPEAQLPDDPSREDLIEECITAVRNWPCLLVVDDIDSLPKEEQYDVFRTISTIFDRVIATGVTRARALLTARLNLGAAPGQLMQVNGLPLENFQEYVLTSAKAVNAPLPTGAALIADIKRLHEASNGSPLFAAAILRLVARGEPLSRAIKRYKGADGEEVRRFAFEKELDSLTDSQLRVLFAAVHLKDCSISTLVDATQGNRSVVADDVSALRDYHLATLDQSAGRFARDEPIVSVPSEIAAMADIVRKKITDPKRIETNCARLNRAANAGNGSAARYIQRVLRYWAEDDHSLAVEAAEFGAREVPGNPDIWCLLGRAYLKMDPPDAQKADAALRKATELGSARPELLPLRLEAKEILGDGVGIVQLLDDKGKMLNANETFALARAYQALGEGQAKSGSWSGAETYYLRGATAIRTAFNDHRAHGLVEPLMQLKSDLMVAYVTAVSRRIVKDDEKVEVWDASAKAWQYDVHHRGAMIAGINAAADWWTAARRRDRPDAATLNRARGVLRGLQMLSAKLEQRGLGWVPVAAVADRVAKQIAGTIPAY
jgi:hypothetical protein